mmetsp:Transcript_120411/g.269163  ORF Transcript_120411/g.269163 Transcript_120411/m.269163 type:complete len:292 (-) Transcript_120411:7-882(-)
MRYWRPQVSQVSDGMAPSLAPASFVFKFDNLALGDDADDEDEGARRPQTAPPPVPESISHRSRQARCAKRAQLAHGRVQRWRKCCSAGPGGATSISSQRKQRPRRAAPPGRARARQATCHANEGGVSAGMCRGVAKWREHRIKGRNQKRWSIAESAPQKPTARGHGDGRLSSIQERRMRTCVPGPALISAPQRSMKYARHKPFLSCHDATQVSCATSSGERQVQSKSASSLHSSATNSADIATVENFAHDRQPARSPDRRQARRGGQPAPSSTPGGASLRQQGGPSSERGA